MFLRGFNNWIKSLLINKYSALAGRNPSVFDICAGKGGDIKKWQRQYPSHYVALEYQQTLIDKAIERLKSRDIPKYPSIFIVADAGDKNTTIDHVLRDHEEFKGFGRNIVFDIVSCQFSMHYLFETEDKLRAFLKNVTCRLEPGGYFIGTTVDAERVIATVRERGGPEMAIGNKYFSIRIGQNAYPKEAEGKPTSPYGLKFYFYLKDAVGIERMTEGR